MPPKAPTPGMLIMVMDPPVDLATTAILKQRSARPWVLASVVMNLTKAEPSADETVTVLPFVLTEADAGDLRRLDALR